MTRYQPKELYLFSLEGQRFLMEPDNCAAYDIDEMTETLLQADEPMTKEEALARLHAEDPADAEELFNGLVEMGLLLDTEATERAPTKPIQEDDMSLSSLVLNVAQGCNMHCSYCFADHGEYHAAPQMMDRRTAEKAVDLLAGLTTKPFLYVYFFGGEPLLNKDVILHTVRYTNAKAAELGKNTMFGITTNGTILDDEILNCFNENKFAVLVSLDGPKETHDKQRCLTDGTGSFDLVQRNLLRLSECSNIFLGCRATTTAENSSLREVVSFLDKLPLKYCHVEPAAQSTDQANAGDDVAERENIDAFLQEYGDVVKAMWQKMKNHEPLPYRTFLNEIKMLITNSVRVRLCSMGFGTITVSAEGDIYACQRLVGVAGNILGNVHTPDIVSSFQPFIPIPLSEKDECPTCWARYLCVGDCAADAILRYNDERPRVPVRCYFRREKIKWTIWIYSKMLSELDREQIDEIFLQGFSQYNQLTLDQLGI